MASIVDMMKSIPNLFGMKGCTDEQVVDAEKELEMKFPQEYVDYVKEYGCIDFGSTEWTGLNIDGRLNTVTATLQERSVNSDFPKGYFVLEDIGIDARKIVVDADGKVYVLQYEKLEAFCDSISEYLALCIKKNT